ISGLVTNYEYLKSTSSGTFDELHKTRKRLSLTHALAVNFALEYLPFDLTVIEEPHGIAQLFLTSTKVVSHPAARARRCDKNAIIANNGIVEVDTKRHRAFLSGYFRRSSCIRLMLK